MSANAYCSNDSTKYVETFVELCPAAQFRIIIQLLYVPVIVVGSILIMATIYLLKKLHTPHDFVLFAIAAVDLFIGVVTCPLYLLKVFPDTGKVVAGSNRLVCMLIYELRSNTDLLSFDLLTLMCVGRFLMVWKPIWYRNRITNTIITRIILGMVTFHVAFIIVIITIDIIENVDWSADEWYKNDFRCSVDHVIDLVIFWIETVVCLCLCIIVTMIAVKHKKRLSKQDAPSAGVREEMTRYSRAKNSSIYMTSLMFVFFILWIPTAIPVHLMEEVEEDEDNYPDYWVDFQRLIRFINSGVNAFLYAATRKVYRRSFKFLLTTPPWNWSGLPRWLQKMESISKAKAVPSVLYSCSRSVLSSRCDDVDIQHEIEDIGDAEQPTDLNDTVYLEAENIVSFNFQSIRGSVIDIANQLWPEKHPSVVDVDN